jgi:hypothetical protein
MTPTPSPRPSSQHLRALSAQNSPQQRKITGPRPMGSRSPAPQSPLQHSDTVVRRKPVPDGMSATYPSSSSEVMIEGLLTDLLADEESLLSYRSSLDSEIF